MGKGYQRGVWYGTGGIISLACFCNEHDKALNYDLMTRTNYLLDDAGGTLSWSALNSFVSNLKGDSALARDLGKATGWEDLVRTNIILADIYDLLQVIKAELVTLGHGKPKKIKPYPRPGREDNTKRIGKGALPKKELREWFRRKENGRRKV